MIPVVRTIPSPHATRPRRTFYERLRRKLSAVVVVAFVAAACLNEVPHQRELTRQGMGCVGLVLLVVATLGRVWAGAYLGGRKTKELCVTGPLSMTRNPLYFCSMLAALGLGLLSGSLTLTSLLVGTFLISYRKVIRDEESRLRDAFGELFDAYCERVPRLWPKPSLYSDEPTVVLHTKPFLRMILDSSLLVWCFLPFEAGQAMDQLLGHRLLPVCWHLY